LYSSKSLRRMGLSPSSLNGVPTSFSTTLPTGRGERRSRGGNRDADRSDDPAVPRPVWRPASPRVRSGRSGRRSAEARPGRFGGLPLPRRPMWAGAGGCRKPVHRSNRRRRPARPGDAAPRSGPVALGCRRGRRRR
jgi:hypothetical protein